MMGISTGEPGLNLTRQREQLMKPYFSFLLRLWQAGTPQNPIWAASLEDPHTHELICFPTIGSLFDYVHHLAEDEATPDLPTGNPSNPNQQ